MLVTNSLQSMSCMSASRLQEPAWASTAPDLKCSLKVRPCCWDEPGPWAPLALPPSFPKVITTSCVPGTLHHPHLLGVETLQQVLVLWKAGQARLGLEEV